MILKLLLIIGVIAVVYYFFIKPKPVKGPSAPSDKKSDSDEMVKCTKCDTYTAVDDAFIKEGRYYCSKECMKS